MTRQRLAQHFGVADAVLQTQHQRIGPEHGGEFAAGFGGTGGFHRDQHQIRIARGGGRGGKAQAAAVDTQVGAVEVGEMQAVLVEFGRKARTADELHVGAGVLQAAADLLQPMLPAPKRRRSRAGLAVSALSCRNPDWRVPACAAGPARPARRHRRA